MERSFWSTIRGKILLRTLLVALLPVVVIGSVAVASLRSLSGTADQALAEARLTVSDDVVGNRVAGVSDQIARDLARFLEERVTDVENWSTDIGFTTAANAATGRANVMGLPNMPIDEIEARFEGEPRMSDVHVERDLVNAVTNTPAFTEISLTELNGYNVDYTNPTADFVQSDKAWWIGAMTDGLHISEPEFDPSSGGFTIAISIRLDTVARPVGVLKASLDIGVVQQIADQYAGGSNGYEISIVDQSGRFLAETSTGHEPDHIMSEDFVATDSTVSTPLVREVFATNAADLHADGHSISEAGVAGYASVDAALSTLRGDMRNELDAFRWTVVVEQSADVAFAGVAPLEGLATEVSSTSSQLGLVLLIVALLGAAAASAMALVVGQRISLPIIRLRDAAVRASEVTLPNVVAQIDLLEEGEELPELEAFHLDTGDEVEDLARSFNRVQQTAADLASHQARLRRTNVATTFVNLGRRNQNLLARQLEHINSMEAGETDADTLQRLFQLDHLATRMRRNAESLLVLAGEETPRRFRQPISMHKLLQAAGSEIEDFGRIELAAIDDASVEGSAASDIAHLLAELLENASTFSPPGSPIQVHGRRRSDSYVLAIIDQGIGMNEKDLAAANARLADPAEFDRAPSAYLGHFVVGHLAKRHGIRVQVTDSPYGITARLHLPAKLLTADPTLGDGTESHASVAPQPARFSEMVDPSAPKLTEAEQAEFAAIEQVLRDEPVPHDEYDAVDVVATPLPVEDEAAAAWQDLDPGPAEAPTPVASEPVAEAGFATVSAGAEGTTPESASVAPIEMTPSGFRRRVRGQEGAPTPLTPSGRLDDTPPDSPAPVRRSPEEVKASLQSFRHGVESGRAQAASTDNHWTLEGGN